MLKQRNDSRISEKDLEAYDSVKRGKFLYGYCGGRFGRDSYGDKLVLSKTYNSVTVLEDGIEFISFEIYSWADLVNSSNKWLEENR